MEIKRFPLGFLWTNCYLLWDEDGAAFVVDPGGDPKEVMDFIELKGLKLHWVLLTHGHGDHLMGIEPLRKIALNGVAIHAEDALCLTSASHNLSEHMAAPVEFSAAERLLKDGDRLQIGRMDVSVIYTPGHTLGGVCYFVEEGEQHLLLAGDTLFARSVGRTDLPGGDESILMNSLRKLAKLSDDVPVYPGHGPDTRIGDERRQNPFWPA